MIYTTLPPEIQEINRQLIDQFGVDTVTGQPMFRVSWADDQLEKRLVKHTDAGIELLFPEIIEKKKYNYIKERWILERLCIIPEVNKAEIPANLLSYECMWNFEHAQTKGYIVPTYKACKFVVDMLYAAMGKESMGPKYVDPEKDNPIEAKEARLKELCEALYGDESDLLLRTVTGEAVAYTGPTPFRSDE